MVSARMLLSLLTMGFCLCLGALSVVAGVVLFFSEPARLALDYLSGATGPSGRWMWPLAVGIGGCGLARLIFETQQWFARRAADRALQGMKTTLETVRRELGDERAAAWLAQHPMHLFGAELQEQESIAYRDPVARFTVEDARAWALHRRQTYAPDSSHHHERPRDS